MATQVECVPVNTGHIPSLVKPDMLDPALTRLLAVNSIYFKGMWKSRFQPEDTKMGAGATAVPTRSP